MNGKDAPRCVACDCDLTMEHILIEYGDFAEVRQKHYHAESLRELFREISVTEVFDLLYIITCVLKSSVESFRRQLNVR